MSMTESDYYAQCSNNEIYLQEHRMNIAIEQEEFNKFNLLKPRFFLEGNKWCVLLGDNIQEGIAGFGDTLMLAIYDWNKQFYLPATNALNQ